MTTKAKLFVFGFVLVGVAVFDFGIVYAVQSPHLTGITVPSECRVNLQWSQGGTEAINKFARKTKVGTNPWPATWTDIPGISCASPPCNLSYDHDDRTPGTEYTYKLISYNVSGVPSGDSNALSATMGTITAPNTPTDLNVFWDDDNRLNITWDPGSTLSSEGGYRLYHSDDGSTYSAFDIFSSDLTQLPYKNINFDSLAAHYFEIRAYESAVGCEPPVTTSEDGDAQFSPFSSPVIVPPRPSDISASTVQSGDIWNLTFTWNDVMNETNYHLQLATASDFNQSSILYEDTNISAGVSSYVYTAGSGLTIYYRIRAYNVSGANVGYSRFTRGNVPIATGMNAPTSLKVAIMRSDYTIVPGTANLYLDWEDNESTLHTTEVYLSTTGIKDDDFSLISTLSGASGDNPPNFKAYNDIVLGQRRFYKVRVGNSSDIFSNFSNVYEVDLDLYRILRGEAWAMATSTNGVPCNGNNCQGIGWVSFNSMDLDEKCRVSESPAPPGLPDWCYGASGWRNNRVPYSVQIDQAGLMSGAAWASAINLEDGTTQGYGWLSFNKGDLEGCPNGLCEAQFDKNANEMSGWARFLGGKENPTLEWDGWVSLSGGIGVATKEQNKFFARAQNVLASLIEVSLWKNFGAKALTGNILDAVSEFWNKLKTAVARAATGDSYGIYYQPTLKLFNGSGWGGAIVGWVAFGKDADGDGQEDDCPFCSVRTVNRKPVISNVRVLKGSLDPNSGREGDIWCALEPEYIVRFDYSDPDGEKPYEAYIAFNEAYIAFNEPLEATMRYDRKSWWRDDDGDGIKGEPEESYELFKCTHTNFADSTTGHCDIHIKDPMGWEGLSGEEGYSPGYLNINTAYSVDLSVSDGDGGEALVSNVARSLTGDFPDSQTPNHYYPFVVFDWDRKPPVAGEIVNFTDQTQAGPNAASQDAFPPVAWHWDFMNGNSTQPDIQNTQAIFTANQPWTAKLTVTDGHTDHPEGKNTCNYLRTLSGTGGTPTGTAVKRRVFRER